ncbi:GntR family transcriptional regulator [Micromonospora sediminimaris]|uniref:GntR family transcriptional regulator n=1 Tax=Micromonospora sediminimaris TaxID=547162 RepID=UPI000B837D0D|nr:GntR family transcriptional regulator [Micromonospora sediminimaris]
MGRQPASSAAVKRSAGATRALFQQVVDDILDQIRDGRLNPNDPLPSARKMADVYGVASMTAQRALRELQNRRITYAVAGKGTFVHPDAFDLLRSAALQEPIDDPELRRRVATYLADQQAITIRYHQARTAADKNTALQDLLDHADTHSQLIDEVIKYQADHGNFAKPPAIAAAASDNDPPTAPTKCRSSHTREPKQ